MSGSHWPNPIYANSSSLDLTKFNEEIANIPADLERSREVLFINGKKLDEILGPVDENKPLTIDSDEALDQFFNKQLLKCFKGSDSQKIAAVAYLKKIFHQGGLLCPVSRALGSTGKDEHGTPVVSVLSKFLSKEIHITPTAKGFNLREICVVTKMSASPEGPLEEKYKVNNSFIELPNGQPLIRAQATLLIDFLKWKNDKPCLTVESNLIDISHPDLQAIFDKRSLLQIMLDFFMKLFHCNQIPTDIKEASQDGSHKP